MHKKTFPFVILSLLSLSSCDLISSFLPDFPGLSSSGSESSSSLTSGSASESSSSGSASVISSYDGDFDPISIHFLELGNANTGDCIYIKAGENDILIDAGSRKGSAETIASYLTDSTRGGDYVSDGKLEYVIATHAHQDHIAGFVGNKDGDSRTGIFYSFEVEHLIDFSYYCSSDVTFDNSKVTYEDGDGLSAIYEEYLDARNKLIEGGTDWSTTGQLFEEGKTAFPLGNGLEMDILYNFFYDHTRDDVSELEPDYKKSNFSDQNDCSVITLFRQGPKAFLFTGDAEEYAEHSIVKFNPDLPKVDLFKAGHHGSYTASGEELLAKIEPKSVVCCCCAGNDEYAKDPKHSFPAQEAIDRIAAYTDDVYVTTLGSWEDKSHFEPMNGNIVFAYDRKGLLAKSFSASGLKLKESDWFKSNRTMPPEWA